MRLVPWIALRSIQATQLEALGGVLPHQSIG